VPFDDFYEQNDEINHSIDEIWEPIHWEMAAKSANNHKVPLLANIIRFKLYQARFNLKNILDFDIKNNGTETGGTGDLKINTIIIQCELESFLFVLNRIMDLLTLMITIIYAIQIPDSEVHFQDFFPRAGVGCNSKSFLIFNELKRKDSILAGQLSDFYFSAENKLLYGIFQQHGFLNSSLSVKYAIQSPEPEDGVSSENHFEDIEPGIFHAGSVIQLEKAYREAVCKFGQIVFNHLNYGPVLAHFFPGYQPLET
jgi:hypothetical protein